MASLVNAQRRWDLKDAIHGLNDRRLSPGIGSPRKAAVEEQIAAVEAAVTI